jgi:hypothetical protein
VAFLATISALILFEAKENDKTTVTVKCERIREGEAFDPFEIQFQKVTVKTKPDKFGRTEQQTLAVTAGAAPAEAKPKTTKLDRELDDMLLVLDLLLGDKATVTEWEKGMVEWMTKSGKKPWASSTFFERVKHLKEKGRVTGGGGQGELYSVATQIQPDAQLQPNNSELEPNYSDRSPLEGERSSRSSFGAPKALRNHSENENRSGSNQDRVEGEGHNRIEDHDTDDELAKKALSQLG